MWYREEDVPKNRETTAAAAKSKRLARFSLSGKSFFEAKKGGKKSLGNSHVLGFTFRVLKIEQQQETVGEKTL
jgi:hypothetical protein